MSRKWFGKRGIGSGGGTAPPSVGSPEVTTPQTDEMIRAALQLLQLLSTNGRDGNTLREMRTFHYSLQPAWMLAFSRFPIPDFSYPETIWRPNLREDAETILAVLQSGILTARLDPPKERLQAARRTEGHAIRRSARSVVNFFRNRSLWQDVVAGLIVAGLIFLAVRIF